MLLTRLAAGLVAVTLLSCVPVWARTLVVYYGSETTRQAVESPNYRSLIEALERSKSAAASNALRVLHNEARIFPQLVESDISALRSAADRIGFDLAVFTNAMAARGQYGLRTSGEGWQLRGFALPPQPPDPVLDSSPLARPSALSAALAEIAKLPGANTSDIVLIVKSHGDETMAVMPRVVADLSRPGTAQELLARLSIEENRTGERPSWATPRGISKLELWDVLRTQHPLNFALVVRDSCRGGILTAEEYGRVPDNVGTVVHSGREDIAFGQVDYAAALAGMKPGSAIAPLLAKNLQTSELESEDRIQRLGRRALLLIEHVPAALYFLPLGLWFGWYIVRPRLLSPRPN